MAEVTITGEFDRPAPLVWQAIADFCAIDRWLPGIALVEAEDAGKRRRIILPDGGVVIEQQVERDDAAMSLSYTVLSAPMPFTGYCSTMRVEPRREGCSVRWSASFTPVGPEDKVVRLVGSLYRAGLKGLQSFVARPSGG